MTTDQPGHQETPVGIDVGLDVVTGAFSYTGRAIAAELIGSGRQVRTITGHPGVALRDVVLTSEELHRHFRASPPAPPFCSTPARSCPAALVEGRA